MEDLEKMLKSVENISKETDAEEVFKTIAQKLFNECVIKKGKDTYEFLEIEFYYYSKNHQDITTYPRDAKIGEWFTHLSGMDIAFNSEKKEDANRPKSQKKHFINEYGGGILVRSIRKKYPKDINDYYFGPLNTMIHLFQNINFEAQNADNIPTIVEQNNMEIEIQKTTRYNIIAESYENKLTSYPNIKQDKYDCEEWAERNYRFYNGDEEIKWTNYPAKPKQ
jgi:hypothetical protein